MNRDLAAVSRYLRRQRNQYMAPFGLKSLHARYLIQISEDPGISQDRLAQHLCSDKSNITRQIAILEEGGFICRQPDPADKRAMQLFPTEKTLNLLPGLQAAMNTWEARLLQDLNPGEQQQFMALLARIRASLSDEEV